MTDSRESHTYLSCLCKNVWGVINNQASVSGSNPHLGTSGWELHTTEVIHAYDTSVMEPPSLVPGCRRKQPGNLCEFNLCTDVTLWQLQYPACGSNCLLSVLFEQNSSCTSAIEWLLLKWNGCDCDVSMDDAIGFYCCRVTF